LEAERLLETAYNHLCQIGKVKRQIVANASAFWFFPWGAMNPELPGSPCGPQMA
jgi:hypothetical protein